MTPDTNPDIVDPADALVEIGRGFQVLGETYSDVARSLAYHRIAEGYYLYACARYGHRPQWGEVAQYPLESLHKRTCQRCGRDLQPAERPKE